ncbi:MAG: hypothetical protein ACYC0O_03745 [Desulfurivibrionaceae bacterium]|nr:hypothetical protein [Planctomycetota bacterium]MCG2680609.1 hypothetical protein [Kiritimatiellia bacterium]
MEKEPKKIQSKPTPKEEELRKAAEQAKAILETVGKTGMIEVKSGGCLICQSGIV